MTFFSARGGPTNEGRMTVNGMTVAAAFNGGGVSSYILDTVNVDEVSVTVSGGMGESDIGGAGDEPGAPRGRQPVPGQAFYQHRRRLVARQQPRTTSCAPSASARRPGIIKAYDASVSYGGPIKRDRLWFFGSYRKLEHRDRRRRHRRQRERLQPARDWDWCGETTASRRGRRRAARCSSAAPRRR